MNLLIFIMKPTQPRLLFSTTTLNYTIYIGKHSNNNCLINTPHPRKQRSQPNLPLSKNYTNAPMYFEKPLNHYEKKTPPCSIEKH